MTNYGHYLISKTDEAEEGRVIDKLKRWVYNNKHCI